MTIGRIFTLSVTVLYLSGSGMTDGSIIESIDLDPAEPVLVSSGIGERFHRPDSIAYDTACKTRFKHPVERLSVTEAIREGYTPCGRVGCFPEANDE